MRLPKRESRAGRGAARPRSLNKSSRAKGVTAKAKVTGKAKGAAAGSARSKPAPVAKTRRAVAKTKRPVATKAKRPVAKTKRPVATKAKRSVAKAKRVVAKAKRVVKRSVATKTRRSVAAKAKRVVAKTRRPVAAKAKRVAAKTRRPAATKAKRVVAKTRRPAATKAKRVVTKNKRPVATKAKRVVAKNRRSAARTAKTVVDRARPPRHPRLVAPVLEVKEPRVRAALAAAPAPVLAPAASALAQRVSPAAQPAPPPVAEPASSPSASSGPVGVRLGRLPPRGEPQFQPGGGPNHAAPRVLPSASAPLDVARALPREPFRHESWQEVDRLNRELDMGELSADQRKVIRAALEGRDVLATLPGGMARIPSFALPARMLRQPTLVVGSRPLLLRELHDRLLHRRVPVVRIDPSVSDVQRLRAFARIAEGGSLVVLATPGMLLREELPTALAATGVALAVLDDAQVVACASDQLSPAAAELGLALRRLGSPPTLALVGPAAPATRHEIIDVLGLRSPVVVEGRAVRDNVAIDVVEARGEVRQRALVQLALELRRPGIIFAPTAREVDAIYGALAALRLPVHRFHPHLPPGERVGEQLNFLLPGRRAIMVATSGLASPTGIVGVGEAALMDRAPADFGLGVEKRDIRFVIHWAPPASLEQYARELALAGRDGEESTAVLFHDPGERGRHETLLAQSRPSARHLQQLAKALEASAIDGRPRTLEALALASGLSGRATESLAALLDDAGLATLTSGWVRALVPARSLATSAERLATRLDRLRARDVHRLDAVQAFASTRSCLRQSLDQLLGEHFGEACGRCGTCRGSVLPGFGVEIPGSGQARRPPVETFTISGSSGDGYGLAVAAPARQARPLTVKLADFQRR